MITLDTIRALLPYNDWANDELIRRATPLADAHLDEPIEMGVGSLRKTLAHIYHGEHVWLERWKGEKDTPWPPYGDPVTPARLAALFRDTRRERDAFLATLSQADLERKQTYLDSRDGYFEASLGAMLVQGFVHSTHHRAQAVNMLRRVGGEAPELDYMVSVRRQT